MSLKFLLTTAIALSPLLLRADELRLLNGKTVKGEVISDQHGQLQLRTSEGVVTFPRSSVAKITRQSDSDNLLLQFSQAAQRGDLDSAVELLPKLDINSSATVRDALLNNADPLLKNATSHLLASIDILANWSEQQNSPSMAAVQLFVAQLLATRGDEQRAAQIVLSLPANSLLNTTTMRQRLAQTLLLCCEQLIDKPDDAVTSRSFALLTVVQSDAPTTLATTLLKVRASQAMAREQKWRDAIDIFSSAQSTPAAAHARRQMLAVLKQSQDARDTTGTASAGSAILQSFKSWFDSNELIEIEKLTALALANCGEYEQGQLIANQMSQRNADAGAQLQHEIEFLRRRATSNSTDPMQMYKLAAWARQMGLHAHATTLFSALRDNPVVAENALLQLQILEIEHGRKELEDLTRLYKEDKLPEVISGVEAFRRRYSDPELTRRALELEQLTKYAQYNHGKRLPDQAEAAFANAQRMYNQGQYAQCIENLNKILVDYPKSAAAKQAQALLDKAIAAGKRQ